MYGSYGSYSSMSAVSAPLDITSSNLLAHDRTCAFPSWPRRSTLSSSDNELPATSFLSDDDLFPMDPCDDDARSISSASSGSTASPSEISPVHHQVSDAELLLEMERERIAMQREYLRQVVIEKERRRQSTKRRRASPGAAKKSPKSKLSSMTPIAEAASE